MKQEIVSVDGHSTAKVVGATYLLIGLLFGVLVAILTLMAEGFTAALMLPVVLMPVLYGMLGYLAAWLAALLYNVVAKRVGGIVIKTVTRTEDTPEA